MAGTILWSNNASTTVSGSITAVSTSVALAAGTGALFPSPNPASEYFVATFYDQATKTQYEIVHVTQVVGDVATIVRAQEGTAAQAWTAGDIFANLVTAGTLRSFVQSGAAPASTSVVYVGTDVSTTPNLIVCNTTPTAAAYATGMQFNIKVANTNTGPVTLQLNGLAAVAATRTDGSPMVGNNLIASEEMVFIYNGVNFTSMVPPIPQAPPQTTFYVRTNGNDNNTGFADTPTQAFATISGGMHAIKSRYISQNTITLRVADGFYTDCFGEQTNYIAAWNIIGNVSNPGNVVINGTPTSQSAYPSPYSGIGRPCAVSGSGNMMVSGFTFQAYAELVSAIAGGLMQVRSCNFTAPTGGAGVVIYAVGNGKLSIYGTCQYTGATPAFTLFGSSHGGEISIGYNDFATNDPLVMNIAAGSTFTAGTAASTSGGSMQVWTQAVAFTGSVPNGRQYWCSSGAGITFTGGNTNIFPGSSAGEVQAPGWIDQ